MDQKILVVDDKRIVREAFIAAFGKEFKIIQAARGEEAVGKLRHNSNISLVILDIHMPGLTGVELIRTIRDLQPGIKIIMMTGSSSEDISITSICIEADAFIEKPFDVDHTRSLIKKLLLLK